jgi:hypothetical protein
MEQQHHDCNVNIGKRIPLLLQVVFLNGNRGNEVNAPPPDASAMKIFSRVTTTGNRRPFRSYATPPIRKSAATVTPSSLKTEAVKKSVPVHKIERNKVSAHRFVMNIDNISGFFFSKTH